MILSLDAQKAFDRLEVHDDNIKCRTPATPFTCGIQQLYYTPSAKVSMMGILLEEIKIKGGTRQRCPLSPLLFAPSRAAPPTNKGHYGRGTEHKISLCADDILLSLSSSQTSLPHLNQLLNQFCLISGFKINSTKS